MKFIKGTFKLGMYFMIGIVVLAVALAVMGGDDTSEVVKEQEVEAEAPKETKPEAKEEAKVFGLGEEVKVGGVTFVIDGFSTADNVGGEYGQDASGTYVLVDVTVRNDSNEAITTDASFFKLKANGKTYEADTLATLYAGDSQDFFYQQVNPDISLSGKIAFDVPADLAEASDLQLNVQTGFWGTEQEVINLK